MIDKDPIKGWHVDLNGVFYVSGAPIDGARESLQWLRETGKLCRFATTTRSSAAMAEKLADLGKPDSRASSRGPANTARSLSASPRSNRTSSSIRSPGWPAALVSIIPARRHA